MLYTGRMVDTSPPIWELRSARQRRNVYERELVLGEHFAWRSSSRTSLAFTFVNRLCGLCLVGTQVSRWKGRPKRHVFNCGFRRGSIGKSWNPVGEPILWTTATRYFADRAFRLRCRSYRLPVASVLPQETLLRPQNECVPRKLRPSHLWPLMACNDIAKHRRRLNARKFSRNCLQRDCDRIYVSVLTFRRAAT